MIKIEVLGSGCAKCKRLEQNVKKAVADLGINATIIKVEDTVKIMEYGIMLTPGLVINGETKAAGRVPKVEEIKTFLISYS
jgi:small redox-active disulfide protein 2